MALVEPHCTITYYPVAYPATAGGVVVLGAGDYLDEGSMISGLVQTLVQRADRVRAAAPTFYGRGGRGGTLSWDRVQRIASPGAALAAALAAAEELPDTPGWAKLEIAAEGRTWGFAPAALPAITWSHRSRVGASDYVRLRYELQAGPLFEIATTAPADALLLETGGTLLTEDEAYYLVTEEA